MKNLIIKLLLIGVVSFVFSCTEKSDDIKHAFHAGNNLVLFMSDGSLVEIPLQDEQETYNFTIGTKKYEVEWVSGGYSFGKHVASDYIIIDNVARKVIEDNNEQDIIYTHLSE